MSLKKKKGSTYVEVIMALTLIGVIAALTIPGVRKHSQQKELGELAHKAYLTINDAVDNAILEEGPMRDWDFSSNATFVSKYLAPNINTISVSGTSLVSKDGMRMDVAECNGNFCHVHVDINGGKAPNIIGKDFFEFQVNKNEENVIPAGYGGADILMRNGWKFTPALWNCSWNADGTNTGCN